MTTTLLPQNKLFKAAALLAGKPFACRFNKSFFALLLMTTVFAAAVFGKAGNMAPVSGPAPLNIVVPTISTTRTIADPTTTVVSITLVEANPTNAATLDYTVTFAAPLTTPPSTGDFTLTGTATGTINSITTTDNINFDVNVTNVSGNGTLELDMTGGSDALPTISNVPFTGGAYTIDNIPPIITIGQPSVASIAAGGGLVTYNISYADANFGTSSLSLANITLITTGTANGVISLQANTGNSYMVTIVAITGVGSLGISIAAGTASDLAGNTAPAASSSTFTVTAPPGTINSTGFFQVLSTMSGTASLSGNFSVSGFNLIPGNLTVNVPSGFDVSTDNINWSVSGGSINLSETGQLLPTSVYLRLDAGDAAGNYSGNVVISGGGAVAANVALPNSIVNPAPLANIFTNGILQVLSTTAGTASVSESFSINGFNLTPGSITLSAPIGFDISTDNISWSYSGGIANITETGILNLTQVYLRLDAGDAPGNYSGTVFINGGGAFANMAVPNSIVNSPPASIISITAASVYSPPNSTIQFTVNFSGPVTGLNINNFTLSGGLPGAFINSVNGVGSFYTVMVSTGPNNGTIGLSLSNAAGLIPSISSVLPFTGGTTIINTTPPAIIVSSPSVSTITAGGGLVSYTITYGSNYNNTLTQSNITLNTTGNANGSINLIPNGYNTYMVNILGITGSGSIGIMVAPGTATDLSGDIAPSAISSTFNVTAPPASLTTTGVLQVLSTTSGTASLSENFFVGGLNLTPGIITLSAPVGFDISTDNINWSYSGGIANITETGILNLTQVYLRLDAGDAAGNYSGSVNITGGGGFATMPVPNSIVNSPPSSILSITAGSVYSPPNSTIQFTVNFSAPVTGLNINNFTLSGGLPGAFVNSVNGSGSFYTVMVSTGPGNGTLGLSFSNAAGLIPSISNALPFTGGTTIINTTQPAIIVSSPSVSTVTAGAGLVSYTITYGGNYNNTLTQSNITLNTTGNANGSINLIPNGYNTYTVNILGITGSGSIGIMVAPGTATDLSGDIAPSAISSTFNVTAPPASLTTTGVLQVLSTTSGTASLSENFFVGGLNLTPGIITLSAPVGFDISTDNINWSYSGGIANITETGILNLTQVYLRLDAGDAPGNYSGTVNITGGGGFATMPVPNSIVNSPPSSILSITAGSVYSPPNSTIQFTVNFSAPVTGLNINNFTLSGGLPGAFVNSVNGSGSFYTVMVSTGPGNGTLGLSFSNAAGLIPSISNALPFTGGTTIINTTQPAIIVSSPSVSTVTAGAGLVSYTITYGGNYNNTLTQSNITLNTTGNANGSINLIPNGYNTYTVNILGITGSGSIGIMVAPGTATDLSGDIAPSAISSTFNVTAPPASLTTTGVLQVLSTTSGTASLSENFFVGGLNLTPGIITLSAPVGFDISTDNINWSYSGGIANITETGILNLTQVYLRLDAGDAPGNYSGTVFINGGGAFANMAVPNSIVNSPPASIISITAASVYSPPNSTIQFTVNFSGPVTGLNINNFTLSGGLPGAFINSVNGVGSFYTVMVSTGPGNGTLGLSFSNAAGLIPSISNALPFTGGTTIINTTPPAIIVSSPSVSTITSGGGLVSYTITYGSNYNNTLTQSNITLNTTGNANGSINLIPNGYNTYMVNILGITGSGSIGIMVAPGTATDPGGDIAPSVISSIFNVTAPPASLTTNGILQVLSTTAGTASVSESFSINGFNLTPGIITLSAPIGFDISTDNISWSYSGGIANITETGILNLTQVYLRLDAGDAPGNYSGTVFINGGGAFANMAVPNSIVNSAPPPPTSTSIVSITAGSVFASAGSMIQFTVTFAAPVSSLYMGNFSLSGTQAGAYISSVIGSGAVYTVYVNTGPGNGTVGLDLTNASTLIPSLTNVLPFIGGTTTISPPPTTVTSIIPVLSGPTKATTLDYTVTFATALTTPPSTGDFTLTGAATGTINSVTGSGNTYDVNVINVSGNGSLELDMTGGSDAVPNISNVPFTGGAYTINQTPPVASNITFVSNDANGPGTAVISDQVTLSFAVSEAVQTPALTIAGNTVTATTTDNINYTATYTLQASDSPDGSGNVPYTIGLTDLAGNTANYSELTTGVNVAFNNTPAIAATGTLQALNTTAGIASSSTNFNVSGVNFTAGNLTVTAPAGFDVSADNAAWSASGGSFTIAETGTLTSTPVYVRLDAGDAVNSYSGNVVISGGGAVSVNEATASSTVVVAPVPVLSYATPVSYSAGTPVSISPTGSGTAAFGYDVNYTSTGTGLSAPVVVKKDVQGNIFVVDRNLSMVMEIPANGSAAIARGANYSQPQGVALDPAGNIYVSCYDAAGTTPEVIKIAAGSNATTVLATGFHTIGRIAVDKNGVVYVNDGNYFDGTYGYVMQVPAGGGTPVKVFNQTQYLADIAVTSTGDIYIVAGQDSGGYGNLIHLTSTSRVTLPGGGVLSVATDASDNIYYSKFDGAGTFFYELPASNNAFAGAASDQSIRQVLHDPLNLYLDFTIDAKGVLYAAGYQAPAITVFTPSGGYFLNNPLPAGIFFDQTTGVISGTPTAISPAQAYQITAYNQYGGATAALSLVPVSPTTVTSINPVSTSPTNATTLSYTITFAEALTTPPSTGDFTLTGAATGTISTITTTDNIHYTVTVTNISGNGSLGLNMTGGSDAVPNISNVPFSGGAYTIDNTPPTAANITFSSNNSNPAIAVAGNVMTLSFTASEAIQAPTVKIEGNTIAASNTSGNHWTATYTMQSTDSKGRIPFTLQFSDLAGNTSSTYTDQTQSIDEELKSTDALLDNLTLSNGTLNTPFATNTTSYNASVGNGLTTMTITPTADDPYAIITVQGRTVSSGQPSQHLTLAVGINNIPIVVTAQDGTTKTYTLLITEAKSGNSKLSSLAPNTGALSPAFTTSNPSYTETVPFGTSTITLTPTTTDPTATVKVNGQSPATPVNLSVGQNSIPVVVTAQIGTTQTYTVTVTRLPGVTLSSITSSNGTLNPTFTSGTLNYAIAVGNGLTTMTVTPTASDPAATVTVQGQAVTTGQPSQYLTLVVGANNIPIVVTGSDHIATQTYTLVITEAKSGNNNLSALAINNGILSPAFTSGNTSYSVSLPYGTPSITFKPNTTDPTATVTVNGQSPNTAVLLSAGPNSIPVVVTAQNGAIQTYTVTVTVRAADANLNNITLSNGTLSPAFASSTFGYSTSVGNGLSTMTITPTADDPNATITVQGQTVNSGQLSQYLALTVGANNIPIVVTGSDHTTMQTYMLVVTEAKSANANLSFFKPGTGSLTPTFTASTTSYTESVANSVSSMTITPTTSVTTATVTINGMAVTSGTTSTPITLNVGSNTITGFVTAQNGVTKTYTLTVTRAPAPVDEYDPGISVTKPAQAPVLADDGIIVHQAISPNGDGINDFLQIDNISQYPDNKLSIMNRSGQLVYEANGYNNSSKIFDGHSNKNGQMQLPGTYFYQLDYTVNGVTKHKTGFIVLKY